MTPKIRGILISGVGLCVAAGLGWTWWQAHASGLSLGPTASPALGILAALCLMTAIGLQVLRTSRLLRCPTKPLMQPCLMAHGMNIWLPSMLGDLFEVWAIARISGTSKRHTLVWLGHRFSGTLAALGILAAVAVTTLSPSLGIGLGAISVAGYLLVDQTMAHWGRWLRLPSDEALPQPLGPTSTLAHLSLAVFQHGIEAAGIFVLAIAVGNPISPAATAGMVSIIETLTYLPIPLGGAGANHWGASTVLDTLSSGSQTATLVATAHALHVGLGALAIGCASLLPRGAAPETAA